MLRGLAIEFRRPLWDYCKQRFAQVTNPPIDSLRESHVMSLKVFLGRAALNSPVLDGGQLQRLQENWYGGESWIHVRGREWTGRCESRVGAIAG